MKAHQPIAAALSLLTLSSAVSAQENAPSAATEVAATYPAPSIENRYYYELEPGSEFHVQFCVPMVKPEMVGKPVEAGWYHTSIPDCSTATWVSTSMMRIVISKPLPPLQILHIEVPAGLKGLKGEILPGRKTAFPTSKFSILLCDTNSDGVTFLCAKNENSINELQARLPQLCYRVDGKSYPLQLKPVRVSDALANWQEFCTGIYRYAVREEYEKRPADEVVPNIWMVDFPGYSPTGDKVEMLLPQAEWHYSKNCYCDHVFYSYTPPRHDYELSSDCRQRGSYVVKLHLKMPAAASDAATLIKSLHWSISPNNKSNAPSVLLVWQDGALRARSDGKNIVLTPTEITTEELQLIGGEVRHGIKTLTLEAETDGEEFHLHCWGNYPTISTPAKSRTDTESSTTLQPKSPYIYTDVAASHLQLRGSTTLRCRYGYLLGGKARVWKLNSSPDEAVRLLHAYGLRYKQGHYLYKDDYSDRKEEERKAAGLKDDNLPDNRVDTTALPGVIATAERPLQPGEQNNLSLPLAELFPGQPVGGLYFVEVEGEPMRYSPTPAINQGLVQVTDLGLLWKTNGRHIFARAYSLSTAQDVPTGTLRFFDKAGQQLGELPVANGLAEGSFPIATRYLQLVTADDCVTLQHDPRRIEQWNNESWRNVRLTELGICPGDIPTPLFFTFSDRNLYRPGETAHVKGIVRRVLHNELSTPELATATAKVYLDYKQVAEVPVRLGEDGTFSLDVPMQGVGNHRVEIEMAFKGDADNTSPDAAILAANPALEEYLSLSRKCTIYLTCKEFRRNEFEVSSKLEIQPGARSVRLSATATNFTTTPVAHGKVNWRLHTESCNFYPEQEEWADFRFGDFRERPWEYYYARYGSRNLYQDETTDTGEGALDAQGQGSYTFTLTDDEFPRLRRLTATTTVTNGNEQSIRSVQKSTLHPADVYAGIRPQVTLAKVGGTLPVELVAVKPDGSAWDGAPLSATVEVRRTVFHPYRYGSSRSYSVRNSEETTTTRTIPVSLTGTPAKVEIPVESAGQYEVLVSGTDAQGRKFCSATRHYVWGDDVSPWEYLDDQELALVPDKPVYRPGETAQVLVQTPVDAELLVTLEREGVLRHFRRSVTVDNPVIEVPIEAGDAPIVYLSVSLVQSDERRGSDGKPQIKLATCPLNVEPVDKKLSIRLEAPQQALLPGEPCTVSGCITDAAGNPVPNADVTLYAEDEGTLQVMGYDMPDPLSFFYNEEGRGHHMDNYSGHGYLVGENLKKRYLGNKGVFIGGGGDMDEADEVSDSAAQAMRRNFNPCALWLASVRTDAQGRFTTTYANPDTLTRYRLMAVAGAGNKFGTGQSSYHVNKPVMLEPVAPMSAAEGDELVLPVTVSMLPDQLPAGSPADLTWQVSLSGQNATIAQPTQSVTLSGNSPVTLHFPIKVQSAAPTQLQWRVQAADAAPDSKLARVKDAVELSFEAIPPTPHLREYVWAELRNGSSAHIGDWVKTPYRPNSPVRLTMSTSPLAGLGYPMQYLFTYPYGCTEQLSSTVLPWILREDLVRTLGVAFPTDKNTAGVIAEVKKKLLSRRLAPGQFSYWDSGEACEFSPYAVMVLHLMGERMGSDINALRQQLKNGLGNCYLTLICLSAINKLQPADLDAVLNREGKNISQLASEQHWVLAICAAQLNHHRAGELRQLAERRTPPRYSPHALPPVEALRALYTIGSHAPQSTVTEQVLRDYLQRSAGQYSTWHNAWLVISVYLYSKNADIGARKAQVNGTAITSASPLHINTTTGRQLHWYATGDPVYVTGFAEGYLIRKQQEQAINKGFDVQRRYEQLQPDGTWKPTATFRVGDIVRITVTAQASSATGNLRYLAIEDRLPATFEAVDPELTSQALPEGINTETLHSWYSFSASVDNREFLKDRVRVFASHLWNTRKLEFSYVARVVRSGKVTAPAAKAELMYRPEQYGLSIPHHFEVTPR
ncbi:MAG: alpha-2-macroglobulin family protein [Akkermansia sp.]|nr:alpha-2-macroglobulin family protein [Akkermansia sp.]